MIFQPIMEDGVFRFDCTLKDREAASPSVSFVNGKDRDTPITTEKVPEYNPRFEIRLEQQIVKLEVSYLISFYPISIGFRLVIFHVLIIFLVRRCLFIVFVLLA